MQPNAPKKPLLRKLAVGLLGLAAFLLLWQLAAWAVGQEIKIPYPAVVGRRLVELLGQRVFWLASLASLGRVLLGFVLGVATGALFAAVAHSWAPLRAVLTPIISTVRATPVASFIILAMVWLGTGGKVAIFIVFLMVLPIVYNNTLEGLGQTDPKLLEMARVFRLSPARVVRVIYLPSVLPYLLAGCVTALGLGWKAGISAEVLTSAKLSIGGALQQSKVYLDTPALFAWTAVVVALSMLLEHLLRMGTRYALSRRARVASVEEEEARA